jgi:hypothetical protein
VGQVEQGLRMHLELLRETGQAALVVAHHVGMLQVEPNPCVDRAAPPQHSPFYPPALAIVRSMHARALPPSSLTLNGMEGAGGFRQDVPSKVLGRGCGRSSTW